MSLSPVAFIAPNYRDYKGWWLKFYTPATTTPKTIFTDSSGAVSVAKLQLNADGFIVSAGGAIVTPYISGAYDAYLFRTEALADANDTTDAVRVADDIGGALAESVNVFDNIAEMKASGLDIGQTALCKKYYAGGELVDGLLFDVEVLQSVDGFIDHALSNGNVAILSRSNPFKVEQAGLSTSIDDCSDAMQAVLSDSEISNVQFGDGNYIFLSSLTCSKNINIQGTSATVIDCTNAAYSGTRWIEFSGSLTQIENLSADISLNASSVTFASSPSLSENDVFVIFNPANASWSGFRSEYFAGEHCKVLSISTNTVTLQNPTYDAYTFGSVNVYRLNPITVNIDNLKVLGDVSSELIRINFGKDLKITNLKMNHSNNSCIVINKSYDVLVSEVNIYNKGNGGNDYGVSVSNSSNVTIKNSNIYSRRHSITTGGDGSIGAVTCRNLMFDSNTLYNEGATVHNADFHGNTEASEYRNCTIFGGATWQGKDNGYRNCKIYPTSLGVAITPAEIKGGKHYAVNCDIFAIGNPQDSSRGVLDLGGGSSPITANTVLDCTFEWIGGTLKGTTLGATTNLMYLRNRGSDAKMNINIKDVVVDVNDFSAVLRMEAITGTPDSDFIIIDNITSSINAKNLIIHVGGDYLSFPHRLQEQSGFEQVTTSTGASTATGTAVAFKWIYPRQPVVQASRTNRGYFGNRIGIAYALSVSGSGLTPAISTDDATDFATASTVDLNWNALIKEI